MKTSEIVIGTVVLVFAVALVFDALARRVSRLCGAPATRV